MRARTARSARTHAWAPLLALVAGIVLFTASPSWSQSCAGADVTARVVAMDQVITYNRLGAFNPAGMVFALARDVFPKGTLPADQTLANSCAQSSCSPGNVQLRDDKRPRPLTLRANEDQTVCIEFENLLDPGIVPLTDARNEAPGIQLCEPTDGAPRPGLCQSEQPATRYAGVHVQGMQWVNGPQDDGSIVGSNVASLIAPGQSTAYHLLAEKEGAYVISGGPDLGGQGGSGAIASGLFGVLNVEPADATWYRNQLTRDEMLWAADTTKDLDSSDCAAANDPAPGFACGGQPILDYGATYPAGHPYAGKPILNILDGSEIFHNEINAVIVGPGPNGTFPNDPAPIEVYPDRGEPFREFTIVFHDEVKTVQAFPGWFDALPFTLGSVKDGFAINYGTGGIGAEIIANRLGVGPMHECVECKYEEFFLTSWVVGDPAMVVDVPANAGLEALAPGETPSAADLGPKATRAFYPDDPSNVWHGYLNDRTKVRNVHVGTEHHIFHLHAHQWLFAAVDDNSGYVDAQALGPGSAYTYEITYGGGGNRNKTAGDSIFHCHFYPHFAQGMWGLWRVHDTFELGSQLGPDGRVLARGLLDPEICSGATCGGYDNAGNPLAGGTPIPAVVPIPYKAMAPMPGSYVAMVDDDDDPATADVAVPFMGYPFYIPGSIGHRPPTPPLDLIEEGGIPRHVIDGGTAIAHQTATDFNKELTTATGYQLPETGTPEEKAAMAFHGPQAGLAHAYHGSAAQAPTEPEGVVAADFEVNGLPPVPGAPYADPCRSDGYDGGYVGYPLGNSRHYSASVIEIDAELNKVGWHFGQQRIIVLDEDVDATYDGTRAPEPFVMRANTKDCVTFDHTNLVPNVYELDDFQVKTPTDVIGQHIHLVKFDVTSADGAANGWNYEDGTLSPDETAERIHALEEIGGWSGDDPLGEPGPRTTRQRWYIDPGWTGNVFTHDHYGPSTHQQAGLYGTMLIEPEGSTWKDPVTGDPFGGRTDGGPTSWQAIIDCAGCTGADADLAGDAWREFYLEFGDFQLAYRSAEGDGAGFFNDGDRPVNPSDRNEVGLPSILKPKCDGTAGGPNGCRPEAISSEDPGTFVVNYRNEPLALRLRDPVTNSQTPSSLDIDNDGVPDTTHESGDLSWAFSSWPVRADPRLNTEPEEWPYNSPGNIQTPNLGAHAGDPFTPLLRVYEGDKVYLRVQVGAHEEGHNFSINGIEWLQQWESATSGFRSSQMAGISEYFIFNAPPLGAVKGGLQLCIGGDLACSDDYLYQTGSSVDARWNGSWGILRSYAGLKDNLQPLPTNPEGKVPRNPDRREFDGVCPRSAPVRKFSVEAWRAADILPAGTLEYNSELHDPTGLLYVLKEDISKKTRKLDSKRRVEPLILRAAAGDCLEVTLTNNFSGPPDDLDGFNLLPMIVNEFNANDITPSVEVGLHPQLVEYDMEAGDGMNVGFNPPVDERGNPATTVLPGESVTYTWYAGTIELDIQTGDRTPVPVEFGAINLSASDPIEGSSKGLIGALVIEPEGSTWPEKGEAGPDGLLSRAAVTVDAPGGSFRDFVLLMQDDVNMRFSDGSPVPIVSSEEEPEDSGMKGINYRTEPIWQRLGIGPTADEAVTRNVDFTLAFDGEPATPIFTAEPCEEVRFRILKPGGHNRNQVFALHGHLWAQHPFNVGSTEIDRDNANTFWHAQQMGHGPSNHENVVPLHGAGGANCVSGDYLYRDIVPVHVYNGSWGLLRVQ